MKTEYRLSIALFARHLAIADIKWALFQVNGSLTIAMNRTNLNITIFPLAPIITIMHLASGYKAHRIIPQSRIPKFIPAAIAICSAAIPTMRIELGSFRPRPTFTRMRRS